MPSDDGLTPVEREKVRAERAIATRDEIAEMDNIFGMGDSQPGSGPVEPESTPEPAPVLTREPEELPIAAESVETPVAEASPETPAEEDEYDFSFINDMARDAIIRMSQVEQTPQPQPQPQPAPEPVQPTPQFVQQAAPAQALSLVTVEEMNEAFNSPEQMIALMQRVYQKAREDAIEQSLLRLPQVARQVSAQVIDQAELVRKFYDANQELKPYKDFVRYCAMQVEAKHPDWSYEKVAEETARVAKNRLPALRSARSTSRQSPALPGSGRSVQRRGNPTQALTALEQEISEMPDRF
jgi:hypothetical protein